jgi:hypothetical protein
MLTRIVQGCDPFSDDHPLLHETLAALAALRDERAVQPIAALAGSGDFFLKRQAAALARETS